MERVFKSFPLEYITFTHSVCVCAIPLGVIHTPESEFVHIVMSRDAHGRHLHVRLIKLVDCEVPARGLAMGWRFGG